MLEQVIVVTKIKEAEGLSSDCGGHGMEWTCPDCNETIRYAPMMWWRLECSCREWDLKIEAIGTRK